MPKRGHDKMSESETGEESTSSTTVPKKPRKNSTKSISDLVDSVKLLIDQNKVTQETLKEVKQHVEEVANNTDQIKQSLTELRAEVDAKITTHESRLNNLESDVSSISQRLEHNSKASDVLYLEVNKLNLILSGLDEPETESTDSLITAIESILQVSTGYFIHLDHAYRVGTGTRRKVKLRFLSIKDRNAALKSSSKLPPTVFINEDLPSSTRQAHGKLRAKLKELKSSSTEEIKVDWKKLSIETASSKFQIMDGTLTQIDKRLGSISSQTSTSSGGTKSGSQLPGTFLGRRM